MQYNRHIGLMGSFYILLGILMFSCSGEKGEANKVKIELRHEDEYWLVNTSKSKTFMCNIKTSSFKEDGDSSFNIEKIRLDPTDETFLGKKEELEDSQLIKFRYDLIAQKQLNMGSN